MPSEIEEIDLRGVSERKPFDFDSFVDRNKVPLIGSLVGLIFLGVGVFFYKDGSFEGSDKIEVLETSETVTENIEIIVEISGAVQKPGVYRLTEGGRIEDLLILAGGISADADREWVEKSINRAAKLVDGQKLYIAKLGEVNQISAGQQSNFVSASNDGGIKIDQGVFGASVEGLVNINTASLSEIDKLPGIGQVYGQSIVEHRPYSSVEELLSKEALKQSVYDKIKDKVTVY